MRNIYAVRRGKNIWLQLNASVTICVDKCTAPLYPKILSSDREPPIRICRGSGTNTAFNRLSLARKGGMFFLNWCRGELTSNSSSWSSKINVWYSTVTRVSIYIYNIYIYISECILNIWNHLGYLWLRAMTVMLCYGLSLYIFTLPQKSCNSLLHYCQTTT